ncbi:hypothetical protein EB008_02640, partial [bacterium]|nr:hypothetical protein [bacterium]
AFFAKAVWGPPFTLAFAKNPHSITPPGHSPGVMSANGAKGLVSLDKKSAENHSLNFGALIY